MFVPPILKNYVARFAAAGSQGSWNRVGWHVAFLAHPKPTAPVGIWPPKLFVARKNAPKLRPLKRKPRPRQKVSGREIGHKKGAGQAQESRKELQGSAAQGVLGRLQSVAQTSCAVRVQRKERGRQKGQGANLLRQIASLRAARKGTGGGVIDSHTQRIEHRGFTTRCSPGAQPQVAGAFPRCCIRVCRIRGPRRPQSRRLDARDNS